MDNHVRHALIILQMMHAMGARGKPLDIPRLLCRLMANMTLPQTDHGYRIRLGIPMRQEQWQRGDEAHNPYVLTTGL